MPKTIYDYVMYRLDDPAQLPVRYLTINEISKLTGKSKKSLHNQFNVLNGVVWEWYGIERFRKEEDEINIKKTYNDLVDLRNRLSNDGEGEIYEEDHLLLDVLLDMLEENFKGGN